MENNVAKIKFEVNVEVTDDDIDDIMASALEDGINYWCGRVKVVGEYRGEYASEQISRGGKLLLYDKEDEEKEYTLTKGLFLSGLKMYLSNETTCLNMWNGKIGIDPGCIDGNAADSIIQYALFDEIIYA